MKNEPLDDPPALRERGEDVEPQVKEEAPSLLHEMNPPSPWQPERDPLALALLGKLLEEVNELGAILARCIIQGIGESEPVTKKPNADALEEELADVSAAGTLVAEHFGLIVERMDARQFRKMAHLRAWHRLIADAAVRGDREAGCSTQAVCPTE